MNHNTDQYYVEKAMLGDTRAFGTLVERYQDFIFTIVLRMVKVREEAEEVAQDAFIKAYESLPSFRGESKFSSWLYSIAYRKALDSIRKSKRQQTSGLIEEITESNFEPVENALQYLEDQERKKIIQDCIMQLPESEAAIITLYYFEELSVREITSIVNLTEDNIKVKLYRSRKKLHSLLEHYLKPELTILNGKAI